KQPLEPARVDIHDLVTGMRHMLGQSLGKGIELEIRLAPDLWPAWIDATQLESALLNLAINARDAMPDGGRLSISATNQHIGDDDREPDGRAGDHVRMVVTDTGAGMPAEVAARAFEPFFTTKEPGHGTGLGLAQIYGFVGQSGGTIRIESEPGRGTSVILCLPRHHEG